jgi:hypothetical protein
VARTTIDEVLQGLDAIIDRARSEESRLGYFAGLYRRVTRAVKEGIANGRFQDGPRMARLDVVFASRYLDAFASWRNGQPPSQSWQLAFEAASHRDPLVLQHLLAGMNAHINLDLGIAAAQTSPGGQLQELATDFNRINAVLAEQIGAVEREMAEISPVVVLLQRLGLLTDTRIINFSLETAREVAWSRAQSLAATPPGELAVAIDQIDHEVALFGSAIVRPLPPLDLQLQPIRAVECPEVGKILKILAQN